MKIREIQARAIITKSNLPDAEFVINPYVGCGHSCLYCYARFMKRFTGHMEPWGKFVDVKINAPDLIPGKTEEYKGRSIFLSSVTDPYLPLERKYQLTRKILSKLIGLQPSLGVQTKSKLVVRDIDLLRQFKDCEVGLSISTLDDQVRQEIEPFTSPVSDRIEALEALKAAGIKTYVFIGPILPFLTDWKEIILKTRHCAGTYMFEDLNITGSIWPAVEAWLSARHKDLINKYREVYFSRSSYWDDMQTAIANFCRAQRVSCHLYFHHKRAINRNKK